MNSGTNRFSTAAALAAAVGLAVAAGCGGPPRAKAFGTVTLDDAPVENGVIQFYPTGGGGQSAGGGVENGRYQFEASAGEMTVTINASKVVGKQKLYDTPDSPVVDRVEELVPAEYNQASTLKVTLKAGDNPDVNFELKSHRKK